MKNVIITGVMAVTVLLTGCCKKSGVSDSSITPPKFYTGVTGERMDSLTYLNKTNIVSETNTISK